MYTNLSDSNSTGSNDGSVNVAKGTAMASLFILSFFFGVMPIKLSKVYKWKNDARQNEWVKLLLGFGGGVLMCTTFYHLLPEVAETFEGLDGLPNKDIHYAELLMCIGFFIMYFVEECVHLHLHRKEKESMNVLRRSLSIRRGSIEIHMNNGKEEVRLKPSNEEDLKQNNPSHNHEHKHHHSHLAVGKEAADSTLKALRGLLVVLALSIHELFEGLAVGLESSTDSVWYMFGAVSAHKLVIAFCIGVELVTSGMTNKLVIIYVFTFAVVSPIGIGVGIIVSTTNHTSTDLVSVILQGLASGTLLYVVFFEILQNEKKSGLKQYFAVLLGFVIMFVIALFD